MSDSPLIESDPCFRVFRGGLSGRYFAAFVTESQGGVWVVVGEKHDVTEDVEKYIALAMASD
jgi:hypothetical protein